MKKNLIGNVEVVIREILDDPVEYAQKISIDDLVDILQKLSYHYYNTAEELVPDEIYDIIKNVLVERDPNNKFLKQVGAQVSKDKVRIPYYMASLDKIKADPKELEAWKRKYRGPYVLSDKLDGVSALFVKIDKNIYKMYTRGDGSMGQDISYLIPYVLDNSVKLDSIPSDVAIRGELIVSKINFRLIKDQFKNGRNAVAGLVNSKNYSLELAKLTDFVAYSIVNPRYKQIRQMELLRRWKFPTVEYIIKDKLDNKFLSDYLNIRREGGMYEIDGIVVMDSSRMYELPKTNPPYGFAFKTILTNQIAEASIVDVEWGCTMHGYLKPRVRIEPVNLGGVEITYATAFNAKYVVDNVLGPGAVIKLVRSGDVIPHILEVLKPSASGKPKLPSVPYKWTKTGVDLLVKDIHGSCKDSIIIKQITHFFRVLGVKHLSEGITTKLVDNGYNTIFKILKADHDDLVDIEGIGGRMVEKIYSGIYRSLDNVTLPRLMAATTIFGRGFGEKRLKAIVRAYPDIMKRGFTDKQLKESIVALEGFDEITAKQFVANFDRFKKFYNKLKNIVDISHIDKPKRKLKKRSKNLFEDMRVVFTGFRNKDLEKFIEDNGGSVVGSVSKNTDLVVYKQTTKAPSAKYKKAIQLNIKVMDETEFMRKYGLM